MSATFPQGYTTTNNIPTQANTANITTNVQNISNINLATTHHHPVKLHQINLSLNGQTLNNHQNNYYILNQNHTSNNNSASLLQNIKTEPLIVNKKNEILKPNANGSKTLEIYINNVVCSYSTKCHLNLRKIATEGMHVEYKRENGMVNMRLRKPHTTATIWSSGKITCAGAKSESDAYKAARRYSRILQKMQFRVRLTNYRVVNVLATCTVPFCIDIIRIANKFQKECSYEPELHPGATFKLKDLRTTLKLFTTGSITLTSPSVQIAQQAINHIYPILYEYRRMLTSLKSEPIKLESSSLLKMEPCDQGPLFNQSHNTTISFNNHHETSSSIDLNPHLLYETLNNNNNNNNPSLSTSNGLHHYINSQSNHHLHHHHQSWYQSHTNGSLGLNGNGNGYDSLISIDHVDDFLP